MTSREADRRALQAKLEHLDGLAIEAGQPFDVVAWLDETRELFDNLRDTLEADPAAGRQVLRRLLVGPVTVTPRVEDGRLYVDFAGTSTYAEYASSLAAGSPPDLVIGAPAVRLVSQPVTGRIARGKTAVLGVMCPRGDSNTRHAV